MKVMIIVDLREQVDNQIDSYDTNIEKSTHTYIEGIAEDIKSIGFGVVIVNTIEELLLHEHNLTDMICFPLWMGATSRNRTAIVPAILEYMGAKFVFGDTYTRIVCQDKMLAKNILTECGFETPRTFVEIRNGCTLPPVTSTSFPAIIKPIFEGSSIGITQGSIIHDSSQFETETKKLRIAKIKDYFLEDFIPGAELIIAVTCKEGVVKNIACAEIVINSNESYMREKVYDANMKNGLNVRKEHKLRLDILDSETRSSIEKLVSKLQKCEFLRLDVRLNDEYQLYVIEVSPMPYIGEHSGFVSTMALIGISRAQLLKQVIENHD